MFRINTYSIGRFRSFFRLSPEHINIINRPVSSKQVTLEGTTYMQSRVWWLYIFIALFPWLVIEAQEALRWTPWRDQLWILGLAATTLHVGALVFLLFYLRRQTTETAAALPKLNGTDNSCDLTSDNSCGIHPWYSVNRNRYLVAGLLIVITLPLFAWLTRNTQRVIWFTPIDPNQADMLPLIQAALRSFWLESEYPYRWHPIGHWALPLTYSPGFWLPYSLPFSLGVDLRLLNAIVMCWMALIIFGDFLASALPRASVKDTLLEALPFVALLILWMGPSQNTFRPNLHLPPYWLFLVGWGMAWKSNRPLLAGFCFGLCLASRPFMIVCVPFVIMWAWHNWHSGKKSIILFGMPACVSVLLLVLPFLMIDPKAFLYGINTWYAEGSQIQLANDPVWGDGFGFIGALRRLSLYHYNLQIAAVLQVMLWVLAFGCVKTARDVLFYCGVALFFFLPFSHIPWFYIFVSPLLLVAMAPPAVFFTGRVALPPLLPRAAMPMVWCGGCAIAVCALAWTYNRPPLHLPFPTLGHHPTKRLDSSVRLLNGFAIPEWVPRDGGQGWEISSSNAYVGVPILGDLPEQLSLTLDLTNPRDGTEINIIINHQPVYHGRVNHAGKMVCSFPIDDRVLFKGMNLLRVELIEPERQTQPQDDQRKLLCQFVGLDIPGQEPYQLWR